jgi:hypothetical protein
MQSPRSDQAASMGHCLTCQGINIESLAQESGYQHLGLGSLRRSRETCRMCDFLCKVFEESADFVGRLFDVMEVWKDTWSLHMQLTEGLRPKLRLKASNTTGPPVIEDLAVRTDELDPARLKGLFSNLSLPTSTSSHESYATAREWIGECVLGHPHAQGSGKTDIQLLEVLRSDIKDRPRRLVHVRSCGSSLVLQLVDALSVTHAYATLSHCVRKSASLD